MCVDGLPQPRFERIPFRIRMIYFSLESVAMFRLCIMIVLRGHVLVVFYSFTWPHRSPNDMLYEIEHPLCCPRNLVHANTLRRYFSTFSYLANSVWWGGHGTVVPLIIEPVKKFRHSYILAQKTVPYELRVPMACFKKQPKRYSKSANEYRLRSSVVIHDSYVSNTGRFLQSKRYLMKCTYYTVEDAV